MDLCRVGKEACPVVLGGGLAEVRGRPRGWRMERVRLWGVALAAVLRAEFVYDFQQHSRKACANFG